MRRGNFCFLYFLGGQRAQVARFDAITPDPRWEFPAAFWGRTTDISHKMVKKVITFSGKFGHFWRKQSKPLKNWDVFETFFGQSRQRDKTGQKASKKSQFWGFLTTVLSRKSDHDGPGEIRAKGRGFWRSGFKSDGEKVQSARSIGK